MRPAAKNVDAYLADLPPDQRSALERVRKSIKAAAPKAEETISYSMPLYKLNGQLVAFAAFKEHCSFFVCSGSFLSGYKDEIKRYSTTKSAIHFTVDKPLPVALVKKLVKARMVENEAKKK